MPADLKFILGIFISIIAMGAQTTFFSSRQTKESTLERWNSPDREIQFFQSSLRNSSVPDILFLGTSRTMNGVDAQTINESLIPKGRRAINLGVNWFGHGLQLSMLESWLSLKKTNTVIIEVPMLFRFPLHPHFQAYCSPVALTSLLKAQPYLGLKAFFCQGPRAFIQPYFFDVPSEQNLSYSMNRKKRDGLVIIPQSSSQAKHVFHSAQQKLREGIIQLPESSVARKNIMLWRYGHQLVFLESIKNLCDRHGATLHLLVLPKCGITRPDPILMDFYQNLSSTWIPPEHLLQKPQLWRDFGHLNQQGASILASWLAEQLEIPHGTYPEN